MRNNIPSIGLILVAILFIGIATNMTFAHEGEEDENGMEIIEENTTAAAIPHLAEQLKEWSLEVAIVALILIILLAEYAVKKNPRKEKVKRLLFGSMIGIGIISTVFLAGGTIYLNIVSATSGPVHWHADYEVWNCNERLDLIDPEGFSNKQGEETIHEHNDDRAHVEGVLIDLHDASYHRYFEIIGAKMDARGMTYPANTGDVFMPRKGTCNGEPAEIQGFLFRVKNPEEAQKWEYEQTKIPYPYKEIVSPYGNVPPGDCLIIEYGPLKEKTEHICASYKVAEQRGDLNGR